MDRSDTPLGRAGVALTVSLATHVADEAVTGFLAVSNPIVRSMRDRVGWFPGTTTVPVLLVTSVRLLRTALPENRHAIR